MFKFIDNSKCYLMLTIIAVGTALGSNSAAQVLNYRSTGLKELTAAEDQKINKTNKVISINPNNIAIQRLNKERWSRGLPQLEGINNDGPDIVSSELNKNIFSVKAATPTATSARPSMVDNSKLSAFPPIGYQGPLGSCVAWATTYYQMSHEVCLMTPGCDNRNLPPAGTSKRTFSPKWTYNLINGGVDGGSWFSDAYRLILEHGAAFETDFPSSKFGTQKKIILSGI